MNMKNQKIRKYTFHSKIGNITVVQEGDFLTGIVLSDQKIYSDYDTPLIQETVKQINEYLDYSRKTFDLPYRLDETGFSLKILGALTEVNYGQTISYKSLALKAGYKDASRACGTVMKNNKLPIIIPCHRVIRSNGEICNYNAGIRIKEFLLNLESNH